MIVRDCLKRQNVAIVATVFSLYLTRFPSKLSLLISCFYVGVSFPLKFIFSTRIRLFSKSLSLSLSHAYYMALNKGVGNRT